MALPTWIQRVNQFVVGRLERTRLRFISLAVLAVSLLLLVVSFATSDRGHTFLGRPLGNDFAGFYTAGTILNLPDREDQNRLYDFGFHDEQYHQLLPNLEKGETLPFLHPPFVAVAFRSLALLPYEWAFAVWLPISAGLYLTGIGLTWRALRPRQFLDWSTALLLALSFEPFIMECWIGGQLSAFGFFCIGLAFHYHRAQRPLTAGLALGLCLYKPTLLVLLLPMMVVARHFRTLAGFTLTGLVLAGISLAGAGRENCLEYTVKLLSFAGTTTGSARSSAGAGLQLPLAKFVDLNSFFALLLGSHSLLNWILILGVSALPLFFLFWCWWRLPRGGQHHALLVWASTLTWSLVINLYVGVYDSILVVLAMLMTGTALCRRPGKGEPSRQLAFLWLLILLYLVPWIAQPLARAAHLQIYTLILMAIGVFQLRSAFRGEVAR